MTEKYKIICTANRFTSRTGWRYSVVTNDEKETLIDYFGYEIDAKNFLADKMNREEAKETRDRILKRTKIFYYVAKDDFNKIDILTRKEAIEMVKNSFRNPDYVVDNIDRLFKGSLNLRFGYLQTKLN